MRRREFIKAIGSVTAWPFVARAQQPEQVRRIGVLIPVPADDPKARLAAFLQRLQQLGWADGLGLAHRTCLLSGVKRT